MNSPCDDCRRDCEVPCWKVDHGLLVEVVHGGWIPISDGEMAECSECGENYDVSDGGGMTSFILFQKFYKFCPGCGAKMDGERKNGGIDK